MKTPGAGIIYIKHKEKSSPEIGFWYRSNCSKGVHVLREKHPNDCADVTSYGLTLKQLEDMPDVESYEMYQLNKDVDEKLLRCFICSSMMNNEKDPVGKVFEKLVTHSKCDLQEYFHLLKYVHQLNGTIPKVTEKDRVDQRIEQLTGILDQAGIDLQETKMTRKAAIEELQKKLFFQI